MFAVSSKEDIESFTSEIGFEYRFNDDYEELKHRGRQNTIILLLYMLYQIRVKSLAELHRVGFMKILLEN